MTSSNKRDAKKPNRPPDGHVWIWHTAEMKASPAWQSMSINARRALDRIELEFLAHNGKENGNLIVTHRDFVEAGVSTNFVADAIDELAYLRLIKVKKGKGGAGTGLANRFQISWLPEKGSRYCDDPWQLVKAAQIEKWHADRRNKAKLQRSRKMPKTARQGFKKIKPHSLIGERPTHGSVSENGQSGNKALEFDAIPTHGSVSTFKTLQGDVGRSQPTAQGNADPCSKNNHTQLAETIGDGAWELLTSLSPETFQHLLSRMGAGTINSDDIAAARLEASRSTQVASQQKATACSRNTPWQMSKSSF